MLDSLNELEPAVGAIERVVASLRDARGAEESLGLAAAELVLARVAARTQHAERGRSAIDEALRALDRVAVEHRVALEADARELLEER